MRNKEGLFVDSCCRDNFVIIWILIQKYWSVFSELIKISLYSKSSYSSVEKAQIEVIVVLEVVFHPTDHFIFFINIPHAHNFFVHYFVYIVKLHPSNLRYHLLVCLLLLLPFALSSLLKFLNSFYKDGSGFLLLMFGQWLNVRKHELITVRQSSEVAEESEVDLRNFIERCFH